MKNRKTEGARTGSWLASFVRRNFWLVLGVGLLPVTVIVALASPDFVSIAAVGVVVFFLVKGVRQHRSDSRIRREGVAVTAAITGVVHSNLRLTFQFQWALTYRYTDHLGRAHDGRSGHLSPAEAASWKVGDTGMVRYDRDRPAESVWLGRVKLDSVEDVSAPRADPRPVVLHTSPTGDTRAVADTPTSRALARRYLLLWLAQAFLLLGGLATLVIAGQTALDEQRYERDGRLAQATVVRKEVSPTPTRKSWGDLVYRFKTPDGREVEGREQVGVGVWEAAREGQTLQVQYLRGGAASNRVVRSHDPPWVKWVAFAGLVFLGAIIAGLGGFLLFKSVRQFVLEERLGRDGVPAAAIVTHVVQSGYANRRPLWVIRYRYTSDPGHTHEGRCEGLRPEEVAGWKVGDTGTILYDRRRPAVSIWRGRA